MKIKGIKILSVIALSTLINSSANAQFTRDELSKELNTVTTSVPFLMITPDSRAAAMGDVGVSTSADINSIYWNVAKYGFIEKESGISISYAPWLRTLVPDVSFSHLSGYKKLGDRNVVSGSFRYFSLGDINFRNANGDDMGSEKPFEMALDAGFTSRLSDNFSVGVALRYIHSNLTGKRIAETKPGNAFAGDISAFYKGEFNEKTDFAVGLSLSNLGSKITFSTDENRDFIPMNMRLGTTWGYEIDDHNTISASLEFSKLLVPTAPIRDSAGGILYGKENDVPVIQGIFQSFGDAPGGLQEEIKEVNWSLGLEYWYDKQFAVRAGYFNEPTTKGDRKYVTAGAGLKYKVFGLDMAYLIPVSRRHPLENQMRFTLSFDLDAFSSQK
jgi:opacity protein-like surface antigen